jgi:RNA polymerase sigma-70 factor (ECF subfamily)
MDQQACGSSRDLFQFADGFSTWSITTTSMGHFPGSSLSPRRSSFERYCRFVVAELGGSHTPAEAAAKKFLPSRILFAIFGQYDLDMTDAEFREAYESHKDLLFRFAWRMMASAEAAEDLVHDCFLLLWRKKAAYDRERGSLRSFLFGVTRNLALKRLGREGTFDELTEEAATYGAIDLSNRDRRDIVANAVASLPPLQREALILAEYEEMSLEEIGRLTGAELPAVKSRLHRARVNLRRTLAPLLEPERTGYGNR